MKKIFIIIGGLGLGGTEKQLLLKLKYLKKKYEFTLIFFYTKGELYGDFKKLGINVIDLTSDLKFRPFKYLQVFFKLYKLLKHKRPEIVNLYLPHSYIIAGLFSYVFSNIIFLMSRRSLNNYQKKIPLVNFYETKILHKKMNYILVNSKAIKKELTKFEGVDKKKIKLIYNSIEIEKIKKKTDKKVRIICLANLIPYKNHKMIVEACSKIIKTRDFQIDLIGDGNLTYKNELKSLSKKLNLEKQIIFWGRLKNYKKILQYADIGILTSNEEGFSNAILEYMINKLPVIATNVGGNPEVLEHKVNGFLIEKGDSECMAKYLEKLIINKKLRLQLGEKGYKKVLNEFEVSKNIVNYEKFYNQILQ